MSEVEERFSVGCEILGNLICRNGNLDQPLCVACNLVWLVHEYKVVAQVDIEVAVGGECGKVGGAYIIAHVSCYFTQYCREGC